MLLESIERGTSGIAKIASGGSFFFVRPAYYEALGRSFASLQGGARLGDEEAADLRLASRATEAESRAAALLARAEQSSRGLRAKLLERGFPARAVSLALERLGREGLLSDERYAEAWSRSRLSRAAEGPATILAGLRARGIDEDTAKRAIASVLGPEERRAALARAARHAATRGKGGGEEGRDELRRELRRLGFRAEEVREYLEDEFFA